MERYVCVHGHFYQPPREDPRTGEIAPEPSAQPYANWNERITAECYRPFAERGVYTRMSFDFGPTLLSWLEKKEPQVYRAVLQQDLESQKRFSGHGSAMAQGYNHIILPLANHRDRVTQVAWGIRDFEWRFGRKPEGMWLPETAVDLETLEILAEQGIAFTLLAPHQALRVRFPPHGHWKKPDEEGIDPRRAYELRLPSKRRIRIFFYDGALSRAVAFEGLASDGLQLAARLEAAFSAEPSQAQLVHVAADGETYGHHHRGADKALDEALGRIGSEGAVRLTNYGEYLEKRPPIHEVEIVEKSSWSCPHGVDRWWSDCGCSSGGHPGWNQRWRTPLRNGLDWLRDAAAPLYERETARMVKDPWAARDRSIDLWLDPSAESRRKFLEGQATRPLSEEEQQGLWKLLELQRQSQLMYTSCGWFFDDLGGIEAMLVLRHAARAVRLAEELFGVPLEGRFLELLSEAKSNDPAVGDGRRVYKMATSHFDERSEEKSRV